jgi:hypothetical protein
MIQALYAHMNNKTIKKLSQIHKKANSVLCLERIWKAIQKIPLEK